MMNDKDRLIATSLPLLEEIKDLTAGTEVEEWLNAKYGPGTSLYEELKALIIAGVRDGWAANIEVTGPGYRRSRICDPTAQTLNFSITAVYMDTTATLTDPEETFRGEYHGHPYGEFNLVVALNEGAALAGPNGWCAGGWTAPAPGSHHYPEIKGGAIIALFFLPAGRISYNFKPDAVVAAAS